MILTLDQITELKKLLSENFGVYLHLHDACGSQSFSFDAPINDEIQAYLTEYIQKLGGTVQVSGTHFIIR